MNTLRLALFINIIILFPLILSFFYNAKYINDSYGSYSTSRDIILSFYLTFLLISIYFILKPSTTQTNSNIKTLLYIQIIYKFFSATTHVEYNPVIISNIIVGLVFIILINIHDE
jgi:hypothetical protein